MQDPTKKHRTDNALVTLQLRVHGKNAAKIREYAKKLEAGEEQTFTIDEVFPDRANFSALRVYRTREDLTQPELAAKVGIPQRHISEMENRKRVIGKEIARRLAEILGVDYRALL
jgi:DNA-binding XRE family transcriptional regulator